LNANVSPYLNDIHISAERGEGLARIDGDDEFGPTATRIRAICARAADDRGGALCGREELPIAIRPHGVLIDA
jgi:hypothetical protein